MPVAQCTLCGGSRSLAPCAVPMGCASRGVDAHSRVTGIRPLQKLRRAVSRPVSERALHLREWNRVACPRTCRIVVRRLDVSGDGYVCVRVPAFSLGSCGYGCGCEGVSCVSVHLVCVYDEAWLPVCSPVPPRRLSGAPLSTQGAFSRCYELVDVATRAVFALKVVPRAGGAAGRLRPHGKVGPVLPCPGAPHFAGGPQRGPGPGGMGLRSGPEYGGAWTRGAMAAGGTGDRPAQPPETPEHRSPPRTLR